MQAVSSGKDPLAPAIRSGVRARLACCTGAMLCMALALILFPARAAADARATLRPASGPVGATVSVTGTHFGRRVRVTVRCGGRVVGRARTSRRGTFRVFFVAPARQASRMRVVSRGGGRRVVNAFRVSASGPAAVPVGEVAAQRGRRMRWTPVEGAVGSVVRLRGAGFVPGRRMRVRFGGLNLGRFRTDGSGRFSTRFTVPALEAGRRFVRVKRRQRGLGFFFTILGGAGDPGAGGVPGGVPGSVDPSAGPPQPGSGGDPVIAAAGDIACDPSFQYFRNGLGTAERCRQKYTSDLLVDAGLSAVLPLGDLQYECGTSSAFTRSYGPSWGRVRPITRPAIGNHEYGGGTSGTCSSTSASGYFGYFGAAAGDPAKGYYSYELGTWHLVALNSNCSVVRCGSSSSQAAWLRQDLAAHPAQCTLAYWHHPRFTSGSNAPGSSSVTPLYQALYDHGADVLLVGHDHHYERFAPQDPAGRSNAARGIREFVVGTGGRNFHPLNAPRPNSEVRNNATFGVLRLTLRPASYDWQFVPVGGSSFRDAGSQACR